MTDPNQASVGLVVKLPFATPEEFLARYGKNITRGGVYLRAKAVKPPGTPVTLDLRLQNGERLLYASAKVEFITEQAGDGTGVSGMGLRFVTVDAATQRFLDSAVAALPHARSSSPPVPANVGTPRYEASGPPGGAVPAAVPVLAAAPAASPAPAAPPTAVASAPLAPHPAPSAPPSLTPALPPTPSGGASPTSSAVAVTSALVPSAPPFEEPVGEPARTGPIIGIDLGTTNSCVGFVRNNKPSVLHSKEGHNTVPSILALNARGKLVIGHPAKGQMLTNPRQTVYGAKRLVGRAYESSVVQQIKDRFAYEVAPGPQGEAAVRLGDRIYSLQQISAMVLREVKELAQNQLGQPISRAVITVPAYYSDNQRQAVREAGRLAGLHVERILNEPTAAALAYGYGRKYQQRILIYDLGGGTFDASVLELHDNVYEVISTGGDTFLGGIDFDNAIVRFLLEEFQKKAGQPFQGDRVAMQRVTDAAERAKCALSERAEFRVHVPFITLIDSKPYDLDVTLTRQKLEALTMELVDRTIAVCDQVLKAKNLEVGRIDEVVLVGGQSRFPLVHEKIQAFFGKSPSKNVHPDEAVALGAALLAHSLGQREGVVLIDVLPMAIGIALPGGRFKPVLERNLSLPATKRYLIATRRDDQRELELNVFQGDNDRVALNEYLGTLKLVDLPRGPRGTVQIEVIFEVSNESLLKVSARELSTGKEVSATLFTRNTSDAVRARMEKGTDPSMPATPQAAEARVPEWNGAGPNDPTPLAVNQANPGSNGMGPAGPSAAEVAAAQPSSPANGPAKGGGLGGFFKRLFGRG